ERGQDERDESDIHCVQRPAHPRTGEQPAVATGERQLVEPGRQRRPARNDIGHESSSRTRGMTSVPYSSMLRIICSCPSVPVAYLRSNLLIPRVRTVSAIF